MLRIPLAVVCLFIALAGHCAALTLDDISLMLRSGVSSGEILEDISRGNIAFRLDAIWEKELVRIGASPALIEAIKSGKSSKAAEILRAVKNGTYEQSDEDKLHRQHLINEVNNNPFAVNPLMSEAKRSQWSETSQQELAQQAAEQRKQAVARAQQAQRNSEIAVAPAQSDGITFKLPSEIEAEKRAARLAQIAARKKYCEEHPVECETLAAAQQARSDAQQAKTDLESLKTQLWFEGHR